MTWEAAPKFEASWAALAHRAEQLAAKNEATHELLIFYAKLLRAQQGPKYDRKAFRARWQRWSTEALEIHEIPGDHNSIFEEPHVRVLADRLIECVQRARSESGEANIS